MTLPRLLLCTCLPTTMVQCKTGPHTYVTFQKNSGLHDGTVSGPSIVDSSHVGGPKTVGPSEKNERFGTAKLELNDADWE
ncbi:hypothetical protein F4802DRAFT_587960 [Xylaria palmicola]|nr:hypothetical protein F4802DRAFT_587960 [Xylaria palmicola]